MSKRQLLAEHTQAAEYGSMPERLEERQILRELVLVGYGREEDLRLLRQVRESAGSIAASTAQQAVLECGFREEYRRGRESQLLDSLGKSKLAFLTQEVALQQTLATLQGIQQPPQGPSTSTPRANSPSRRSSVQGSSGGVGGGRGGAAGRGMGNAYGGRSGAGGGRAITGLVRSATSDPVYSAMMQRLHRLHVGLKTHVAEDGSEGARVALHRHVLSSQGAFDEGLAALKELVEGSRGVEEGVPRAVTLRFGHLGSTLADLRRVESFKRQRAARVIQRSFRTFLSAKEFERRLMYAEELRLVSCARRIQRTWRAFVATRRRREALVSAIRATQAAVRIQRWYRARRKVSRAQRAAVARLQSEAAEGARLHREALRARVEESQAACTSGADPSAAKQHQAARTIQRIVRGFIARRHRVRRLEAVLTIQRCARGFLVRKRGELTWKHAWRALRERRAQKAAWEAQQTTLRATMPVLTALAAGWARANSIQSDLSRYLQAEVDRYERAWRAHEALAVSEALKRPLPKHWIPQMDPHTGETIYIYTKEGTLHRHNPHMARVRPLLAQQRAESSARLQEQLQGPMREAEAARLVWAAREAHLMSVLAAASVSDVAPRPNVTGIGSNR